MTAPPVAPFQGGGQSLFPLTQGCTRCARFALGYPVAAFQAGNVEVRCLVDDPSLPNAANAIDFRQLSGAD
jgi:hypothetical protein